MATPEPYPYRKLNFPINNLEQSFTQAQKLQTRSNIGVPSSVDEEGKVLMVDNAAGELVWAEAPNGLPDIASGDEGKFLSVENGEPAWTDVDIPEQVNADWDATSGVQEILNRPDVKPLVAGSNITITETPSSVEIAGVSVSQVNADWDATSGVQEILNKPTVKQVVAGSNITITETANTFEIAMDTPIPSATSDLTNDSGFVTLSDLPPEEVAVMTYGTSTIEEYRAAVQSGKKLIVCKISDPDNGWRYVMQSQSSPFPQWSYDIGVVHYQLRLDHNGVTGWTTLTTNSTTSADAGKVFTVDQYGRQVWASGGGGGSQVNADWDAVSGAAEILNKPVPKTLTAGTGISITENASTITITNTATPPTVDQTYDGTSAHPQSGTAVADAIGNLPTNLSAAQLLALKQAMGVDETVLWNGEQLAGNTVTLSESAGNFEYLGVYVNIEGTGLTAPMFYKCMQRNSDPYGTVIRAGGDVCKSITSQEYQLYSWGGEVAIKGTSCQIGNFYRFHFNGGGLVDSTNLVRLYRVVGIHRIASN